MCRLLDSGQDLIRVSLIGRLVLLLSCFHTNSVCTKQILNYHASLCVYLIFVRKSMLSSSYCGSSWGGCNVLISFLQNLRCFFSLRCGHLTYVWVANKQTICSVTYLLGIGSSRIGTTTSLKKKILTILEPNASVGIHRFKIRKPKLKIALVLLIKCGNWIFMIASISLHFFKMPHWILVIVIYIFPDFSIANLWLVRIFCWAMAISSSHQ